MTKANYIPLKESTVTKSEDSQTANKLSVINKSGNSARSRKFLRSTLFLVVGIAFGYIIAQGLLYVTILKRSPFCLQNAANNQNYLVNFEKDVRVLCWILTVAERHKTYARHAKNTWSKRCDQFLIMSTDVNEELDAISLPFAKNAIYDWGKTKAALKYIYKHHFNDADWFVKTEDSSFIFMENLRNMLRFYEPKNPMYFSCSFHKPDFPEYVLSREALRRVVNEGFDNPKKCKQNDVGPMNEALGNCLANVKVLSMDSSDSDGQKRMCLKFKAANDVAAAKWKTADNISSASNYAISLHSLNQDVIHKMEYMMYRLKIYYLDSNTFK